MDVLVEYLIQNWALILVLLAFAIMLKITVFLSKRTVVRMYISIIALFLLSIIVFTEFYVAGKGEFRVLRLTMTTIRYSATPIILSMLLFTLVKRARWYVLLPAFALAGLNVISAFTGFIFDVNDSAMLVRGALWFLPYVGVGVYSFVLVVVLVQQSNKQATEIIPICFLAFAFVSGLVLPFVMQADYSKIFCPTLAIGLFVYYVFLILQLTTKDALTGLLNRQAYYAAIRQHEKDVTALVSVDMNGLKTINDTQGHQAGDEALSSIALSITQSLRMKQSAYRIGGDEFVIVCRKNAEDDVKPLVERIKSNVARTPYSCSIGYCYAASGTMPIEEMARRSDEMMYADKARYYAKKGNDRRQR